MIKYKVVILHEMKLCVKLLTKVKIIVTFLNFLSFLLDLHFDFVVIVEGWATEGLKIYKDGINFWGRVNKTLLLII